MSIPFLHDIILKHGNKIQFTTNAGANAGSIDIDNSGNLVLNNTAGDILLGDGASDVYIGDGTNNVDILFEQSGAIKADDSATGVTITLATAPDMGSADNNDKGASSDDGDTNGAGYDGTININPSFGTEILSEISFSWRLIVVWPNLKVSIFDNF